MDGSNDANDVRVIVPFFMSDLVSVVIYVVLLCGGENVAFEVCSVQKGED